MLCNGEEPDSINFTEAAEIAAYYSSVQGGVNIPVDYTSTLANSINGFNWQNAAYGQFTGVKVYRPKEVLYFDYTPSAS